MGKPKLSQEERRRRIQERNRLYWESHREEIALNNSHFREVTKMVRSVGALK